MKRIRFLCTVLAIVILLVSLSSCASSGKTVGSTTSEGVETGRADQSHQGESSPAQRANPTTNGGVDIDRSALPHQDENATATVYFISDITPESLTRVYQALDVELSGKVGIKLSTGESEKSNYLRPALIGELVQMLNGTIVECNTAYGGSRASTAMPDSESLVKRIESRNGLHTLDAAEDIGLGSRYYKLVIIE